MFRAVVEEAAALASITLFLGMIAVWAQVLGRCRSSALVTQCHLSVVCKRL